MSQSQPGPLTKGLTVFYLVELAPLKPAHVNSRRPPLPPVRHRFIMTSRGSVGPARVTSGSQRRGADPLVCVVHFMEDIEGLILGRV